MNTQIMIEDKNYLGGECASEISQIRDRIEAVTLVVGMTC